MYENLETLHPVGQALLERLKKVPADEVDEMRKCWPSAPEEYFAFLQERGHGEMKEFNDAFPLLIINKTLDAAEQYFGDNQMYEDGPYEQGAKGKVLLFATDSTGTALGFDSGDNWRLVEVDNMRWVARLDLTFKRFIEGLLVCYPQRPVRFIHNSWYDSGDKEYFVQN